MLAEEVFKAFFTGIVGAAVGYYSARLMNAANTEKAISDELWKRRNESYQKLWSLLKAIPKWPARDDLNIGELREISSKLKDWYFDEGGIILTARSVRAYRRLQGKMAEYYENQKKNEVLKTEDYGQITKRCSRLRTAMTRDLLSRERLFIR